MLEVGPCGGGEARRQGILWEYCFAQCGQAGGGGCLVFRTRVGFYGNLYAKVGDDLVGGPAAVARLERGEGLDLARVSLSASRCGIIPTVGFFLNMLNYDASAAVAGCRELGRDSARVGRK